MGLRGAASRLWNETLPDALTRGMNALEQMAADNAAREAADAARDDADAAAFFERMGMAQPADLLHRMAGPGPFSGYANPYQVVEAPDEPADPDHEIQEPPKGEIVEAD